MSDMRLAMNAITRLIKLNITINRIINDFMPHPIE